MRYPNRFDVVDSCKFGDSSTHLQTVVRALHGALPVLFCNRRLQYNPLCVSQQWHASAWRGYSCAFVPHGGSRRPLEGGGSAGAGWGGGGGQLFTVIQCYVHCCDPTCTALISVQVLTESIMCILCTLLPKSIMCIVHTAKSIMCIDFCSVFLERLESNCGFLPYHQSDLSQHCPCESY